MEQPDLTTAQEIMEYLLTVSSKALLSRDYDVLHAIYAVPHRMTTMGRVKVFATACELQDLIVAVCDQFERDGVTELDRRCIAADFNGVDRVHATYVGRILAGEREVVPAYPAYVVIERHRGRWRIVSVDYAIEDDAPQAAVLHQGPGPDRAAMAILQDYLDRMSDTVQRNDFDSFSAGIELPFTVTTESDSFRLDDAAQLARFFQGYVDRFGTPGHATVVRLARSARLRSENELIGEHDTHQLIGSMRIAPPYPNRVRLVRGADGGWRATTIASAVLNTAETYNNSTRVAGMPYLPPLNDPFAPSKPT